MIHIYIYIYNIYIYIYIYYIYICYIYMYIRVYIVLVHLPRWVHARRAGAVDIQLPQPACHVYFLYITYRFTSFTGTTVQTGTEVQILRCSRYSVFLNIFMAMSRAMQIKASYTSIVA
jgi:hypothetical protein